MHRFLCGHVGVLREVAQDTCISVFQTSCEQAAIAAVFDSNMTACQNILFEGPSSPVLGCMDFNEAADWFEKDMFDLCQRQPTIIPSAVTNRPENKKVVMPSKSPTMVSQGK